MRNKIIFFFKQHGIFLNMFWKLFRIFLQLWSFFVPVKDKTMLFASFGGRKFDDSPRALYETICREKEFNDWELIWVFVNPDDYDIPRGRKVKIDSKEFFHALLYSRVWVSNSGIDRGLHLKRKNLLKVETWHGTPLKKILGDENENSLGGKRKNNGKVDSTTIRCAQSEYDKKLFERLFNASPDCILLSDLPRNDSLVGYDEELNLKIRGKLGIGIDKTIILYTPTYREYLVDDNNQTYIKPPMDLQKWKRTLGDNYVILIRAHYAVAAALSIVEDEFVKDVSSYPSLNDLYIISDMMISDYSSTFFDYSILDRPMFCFAYDLEEYQRRRGLYLDLEITLPCPVDKDEHSLLDHIRYCNYEKAVEETKSFHKRFAPYAGNASTTVISEMKRRLQL